MSDLSYLEIVKLAEEAALPSRAHPDDAGLDLYALEDVSIDPGQGKVARTGVAVAVHPGHVGLVADRSSLASRGVVTAGGIIDAGFRGELRVVLRNLSREAILLRRGERIAQLLIVPVALPAVRVVERFERQTPRGERGFGSTGS